MKTLLALIALTASAYAGSIGSAYNYCQSTLNSAGSAATISYTGSLALADASFTLTVTGQPEVATSFGMFTCGSTQYNVPFGNGHLCIMPFQGIQRMTPQNLVSTTLQKSIASEPQEFANFVPGSSWNFQFWYRDYAAGGAYFNLSDALHVDFAQ